MAKTKVILYANNHFKYRLEGSRTWTPLIKDIEHEIEFNSGDRVELSSIKSLSKLKIKGAVKTVNIYSSDITSLEGAFEGTRELDHVEVNSSLHITNMEKTFKDSGILSFDIQTTDVINFIDTFNGTSRIEEINIDTASADDLTRTFKNSSVKSIENILPYKEKNVEEIFVNSKNIKSIDAINLSTVSDDLLRKGIFKGAEKIITGMDISFFRGKISARRKYFFIKDNEISSDHIFEMDTAGLKNEQSERGSISLLQKVDDTFDFGGKEFEIDIEPTKNEVSERMDIEIIQNTDDSSSFFVYESEIDFEQKNLLNSDNREYIQLLNIDSDDSFNLSNEIEIDIDSNLLNSSIRSIEELKATTITDDSFDLNTYDIELDIDAYNIDYIRNDLNISSLDDSFDNSKLLEMDIDSGSYDSDPLNDNSMVFMTDTFSRNDMISNTPLVQSLSYTSTYYGIFGQNQRVLNCSCQSIDLSNNMISNFSFEYVNKLNGNIIYEAASASRIFINFYGNKRLTININGTTMLDLSDIDQKGIFNFCRDGDNFYVYVNNELVGSGTKSFTPFTSNGVIKLHINGDGRIWNIRAFSRYITQNDVLYLNSN